MGRDHRALAARAVPHSLDSSHEDYNRATGKTERSTPPPEFAVGAWLAPLGIVRLAGLVPEDLEKTRALGTFHEDEIGQLAATYQQSHIPQAILNELVAIDEALFAGGQPPDLGDLPLLVLSRDAPTRDDDTDDPTWEQRLAFAETWADLQADLASRSTRGELRVVRGSGHQIATEAPEETAAAIVEMVGSVRAAAEPDPSPASGTAEDRGASPTSP